MSAHAVKWYVVGLGAVVALVSSAKVAGAQAVGSELTLGSAIAIARSANPGLQADENDGAVADASLRAAQRDLLVPTVSTTSTLSYSASGQRRAGSVLLTEQPTILSSSYGLMLGYNVSGARMAQPGAARADRRATMARLASSEAQLEHDVAVHYLAVLQAESAVAQSRAELSRSADFLKLTRVREALGAASTLDVKRAEVQVAQGEVRVARAESDGHTERASLARLLGVAVPAGVKLTTTFTVAAPTLNADSLVAAALRRSVALEAKRSARDAAVTRARIAGMAYLPTVNLSMSLTGWTQRAGSQDAAVAQRLGGVTDSIVARTIRSQVASEYRGFPFNFTRQPLGASVTVSYPILPGWTREAQMAQSRAARSDAEFAIKTEEWRIRTEIENGVRAIEAAYREARLQAAVKEKSAEELKLVLDRARLGSVNGITVADAQSQLLQAELAESDAIFSYHRALLDLELSAGFPITTFEGR
jgi:outer membrane protein